MTTKNEKEPERFDQPYDDVFDAEGNLVESPSVKVTLAALRRSKFRD